MKEKETRDESKQDEGVRYDLGMTTKGVLVFAGHVSDPADLSCNYRYPGMIDLSCPSAI